MQGLCPRCLHLEREPAESEEEGETPFGTHTLLGEIGRGGMGTVYRARPQFGDRLVALKAIAEQPGVNPAAVRRFEDEVRALTRLEHPGIVPVYDVGVHRGRRYYTMKLLEGGTLAARRTEHATPERAAALVAALARAAHAAHERGVVHRDLKPENVLFHADGSPCLVDFGVAKLLGEVGDTLSRARVGTLKTMSPEQARGDSRHVTAAADVWSLGVVLYWLLAGCYPFEGSREEILSAIADHDPAPPSKHRPGLPPQLDELCLACLQKDAARRPASAAVLAGALERFLAGGPWGVARRWIAANRAATAIFLAASISLAALSLLSAWHLRGPGGTPQAAAATVLDQQAPAVAAPASDTAARLLLLGWSACAVTLLVGGIGALMLQTRRAAGRGVGR